MKYYLWLIVLFVLIPISVMRADEKKSFVIEIPREINEEYIIKNNLVPLDFIDAGESLGIVPFVTEEERAFMGEHGQVSDGFEVKLEVLFCLCDDHFGNRVQIINFNFERGGMQPVWLNPEMMKGGYDGQTGI